MHTWNHSHVGSGDKKPCLKLNIERQWEGSMAQWLSTFLPCTGPWYGQSNMHCLHCVDSGWAQKTQEAASG